MPIVENFKKFYNEHKVLAIVIIASVVIGVIGLIIALIIMFNNKEDKSSDNSESFTIYDSEKDDRFDFASSWINSVVGDNVMTA